MTYVYQMVNKHLGKCSKFGIEFCHFLSQSPHKGVIDDSPYYVFVVLCIVVIVVSLMKIAASNENIECFREYFAVGYRAPDPSFFLKFLHSQDKK